MPIREKVIVQWYITYHPAHNKNKPFVNSFSWNKLDCNFQETSIEKSLSKYLSQNFNPNDFPCPNYNGIETPDGLWQEFSGPEIKYIGNDRPKRGNINIFPLRFTGDHREYWTDPKKWILLSLPDIAINFLRNHPWVAILIHDIHESQNVTSNNESFVYSLGLQRNLIKINNPIFWISASSNPKESYIRPNYIPLPNWLYIGGSHQWLEKPFYEMKNTESPNLTVPEMEGDVRFLCYAGRLRMNRMFLASKLIDLLPSNRLWISVTGHVANHRNTKVISLLNNHKNINKLDNIPYNLTEEQEKEIIDCCNKIHDQMPISTFPPEIADSYFDKNVDIRMPNLNHYKNIFVDIVLETFNERQGANPYIIFITQKTRKPILACRPFIVSANAGFYKELHKLGFKTFSNWWDESFDDDVDFFTANNRLLNTVNEINSWSRKKCLKIFEDMKPTLLHNYKILNDIIYNRPRSWLSTVRELHKEWAMKDPDSLFY